MKKENTLSAVQTRKKNTTLTQKKKRTRSWPRKKGKKTRSWPRKRENSQDLDQEKKTSFKIFLFFFYKFPPLPVRLHAGWMSWPRMWFFRIWGKEGREEAINKDAPASKNLQIYSTKTIAESLPSKSIWFSQR